MLFGNRQEIANLATATGYAGPLPSRRLSHTSLVLFIYKEGAIINKDYSVPVTSLVTLLTIERSGAFPVHVMVLQCMNTFLLVKLWLKFIMIWTVDHAEHGRQARWSSVIRI